MSGPYDDIIDLPHHVSNRHPHMPVADRAAQFAPFAALTGYDAALRETARLTDRKTELTEDEKALLDRKQQVLLESAEIHPEITVIYFKADERKDGGTYVSVTGHFRTIDPTRRQLVLTDKTRIPLDDILDLESDLFRRFFCPRTVDFFPPFVVW